jgi:hypothetical protein
VTNLKGQSGKLQTSAKDVVANLKGESGKLQTSAKDIVANLKGQSGNFIRLREKISWPISRDNLGISLPGLSKTTNKPQDIRDFLRRFDLDTPNQERGSRVPWFLGLRRVRCTDSGRQRSMKGLWADDRHEKTEVLEENLLIATLSTSSPMC